MLVDPPTEPRFERAPLTASPPEDDWAAVLSLGEQQRVSFVRVLLVRPTVVFLDESTSALDEGLEDAMYALVRERQ